jgi:hypothetical protein
MVFELIVDISGNSDGLILASSDSNTYTSQGYTRGDPSFDDPFFISNTQDIVVITDKQDVKYASRVSYANDSTTLVNVFEDITDPSYNPLTAIYYTGENPTQINATYIGVSGYGYIFKQTLIEESQDVSGVYTLFDASNNNYGTVVYDEINISFTSTNEMDPKYNYQNISIVSNCLFCKYYNDLYLAGKMDDYKSGQINAMYAMNASVFDKL